MILVILADRFVQASFGTSLLNAVGMALPLAAISLIMVFFPLSRNLQQRFLTISLCLAFAGIPLFLASVPAADSLQLFTMGCTLVMSSLGLVLFSVSINDRQGQTSNQLPAEQSHDGELHTSSGDQLSSTNQMTHLTLENDVTVSLQTDDLLEENLSEGEVIQSWSRVRFPDGNESLEGSLSVQFSRGEQFRHCHIPFSPPFKRLPQAWWESSEDNLRGDFSMMQSYGCRLTLRRSGTELQETTVDVSILLTTATESKYAA